MLDPEIFWLKFEALGVNFATGVPDSLIKDFCYFLEDNLPKKRHIIAANEGGSIAIATGHYISSEKPALVYMQNSGIGNAINPLLSLADEKVYSIPMILIVGWRGRADQAAKVKGMFVRPEQVAMLVSKHKNIFLIF